MFAFYKLGAAAKPVGMFDDLADLADWFDVFEDVGGLWATVEIEVAEGVFEVVVCNGKPLGTVRHAAPASLLAKLQGACFYDLAA